MYTNKQYSSVFQSLIKKKQNKKHVNSKPKVLYNTMFEFVSNGFGLQTFIVEQSDSVNH